jgi:outer membrane protein TolC
MKTPITAIARIVLTLGLCAAGAAAQTAKLGLREAVELAMKNYPAVRAASEQVNASRAGVDLARTSYLPRADMMWQANRATENNISGLLLPNSVLPSISGRVPVESSGETFWGGAAGLLVSWEPFDFGARGAAVQAARAGESRASAELKLTTLQIGASAADTFFLLLASEERVRAAQADVDRRKVVAESVGALVKADLRPGADASRAEAELAAARTALFKAQESERVTRAALGQWLNLAPAAVQIDGGALLGRSSAAPASAQTLHPLTQVDQSRIDEVQARLHALERAYFPKFNLQSAVFGRGSGIKADGRIEGGPTGLGPDRGNWAVGLTVTFALGDRPALHAREAIEAANRRREEARLDEDRRRLSAQEEQARAAWESARQVSANTPVQLAAAQASETQARARFQAGLGTLVEVADAQRLLVQADTEDRLARVAVWRGLLLMAAAKGDLQPFLDGVK